MCSLDINIAKKYAPIIYFDKNEPFFPVLVATTILNKRSSSPSFDREFLFDDDRIDFIIEFAIYWDFDIQHLYELEHIWIYVAKDKSVLDCEASSHGGYIKGMLTDKSNLDGNHVKLYAQPGKHAFSTCIEDFGDVSELEKSTYENAGNAGLIITKPFLGTYETNGSINRMVQNYLQMYRFKPSMKFEKYVIPDELYVTWKTLYDEVPKRIKKILSEINIKTRTLR